MTRLDPPGPLGALIDRPPPTVSIASNGAYPNPLAEPVPAILTPDIVDAIVAERLRLPLDSEARESLAVASLRAVSAPTGATVLWQTADAGGAVVPMRDAYRSHRGKICRDLEQQLQDAHGAVMAQVTLCHVDAGNGHVDWLPGSAD